MADRWEQAKAIFHAALEQAPAGREAFLEAACRSDPDLRREVDSLLASDDEAGEFLASPAGLPAAGDGPAAAQQRAGLTAGVRLGPYEVLGLLASGGMGEVYRARDTRLGREVAVKVLPAEISASPDRIRRFEQEARAASALNHPNILTVFDVGARDGAPYLVMELLEGESLADAMEGGLSVARALDYALQIARGLAAAHEKVIVHRDLKPANVSWISGWRGSPGGKARQKGRPSRVR